MHETSLFRAEEIRIECMCLQVVTYLAGCGLQSCAMLVAKGYPDLGWNPIEGERYLSFLRFAVFCNGKMPTGFSGKTKGKNVLHCLYMMFVYIFKIMQSRSKPIGHCKLATVYFSDIFLCKDI